MAKKGYILQLQDFSVNDGEGIRTTVFLAGCPLRCEWCSNPEGITTSPKVAYYEDHCVFCGACAEVCPNGVGINMNKPEERGKCTACGLCVKVCLNHARKNMVEEYTTDEIVNKIKRQIPFFIRSGGGVTFSGGEATLQIDFLKELADKLYDLGVGLTLETSGYFNFDEVKEVLEKLDLVFVDMKHMDNDLHKKFTGVGNTKILDNIKGLSEIDIPVVIRIPIIKGMNADEDNIRKTALFVKENLPKAKMELLPYHNYGDTKYESLGMAMPSGCFSEVSAEEMERLKAIIETCGVELVYYR